MVSSTYTWRVLPREESGARGVNVVIGVPYFLALAQLDYAKGKRSKGI